MANQGRARTDALDRNVMPHSIQWPIWGYCYFFYSSHTCIITCHFTEALLQANFTGQFFVFNTSQLLILSINPVTTASLMENREYGLLFLQPQHIPHRNFCCVLSTANPVSNEISAQIFCWNLLKMALITPPSMTIKLHNTKCRIPLLSQQQISNRS
jgi:hypothetical protein